MLRRSLQHTAVASVRAAALLIALIDAAMHPITWQAVHDSTGLTCRLLSTRQQLQATQGLQCSCSWVT